MIADRIPIAYSILGDLYYKPDENGQTDKKFAVQYYMKAEEHAVLGRRGAERVLDYYLKSLYGVREFCVYDVSVMPKEYVQ